MEPEVILMDEPCSALDPLATAKIEESIAALKKEFTVVIVTHNLQQAARVSDSQLSCILVSLSNLAPTKDNIESPKNPLTEKYITGEFG